MGMSFDINLSVFWFRDEVLIAYEFLVYVCARFSRMSKFENLMSKDDGSTPSPVDSFAPWCFKKFMRSVA